LIRPTEPSASASPILVSSSKAVYLHGPIDTVDAPHGGMARGQWWWRKTAVPLVTSLSLHAGLLAIGLLCFTAYKVVSRPADPPPLITPLGEFPDPAQQVINDDTKPLIPIPHPAPGDPGNPEWPKNPGPTANPTGSHDPVPSVIVPGWHLTPNTTGKRGPDDSGPLSFPGTGGIFDPSGNNGGPRTIGDPANRRAATSIAYVCDASGSMMAKMSALKLELSRAIMKLRPWQEFSVIFFQDEQPTLLSPSLVRAIPENKAAALAFLDGVATNGRTDPIPGIRKAFAQHPQIMFLLTDGDFPQNDAVLAEIHRLEKQEHVVIHTIAFTDSDNHDVEYLSLLKQVAKETGGTFKKVDA
jgi:hypothetical protein